MNTFSSPPSWDTYFLNLAQVVKTRSNCIRMAVGVVIVHDKRIIATGYNGSPTGIANCYEGGCERCRDRQEGKLKENERKDLCVCIHAEQNALLQASYHGTQTKEATMYTTVAPCLQCAKAIINAGVVEVVYAESHQDDLGLQLLEKAGVKTRLHK